MIKKTMGLFVAMAMFVLLLTGCGSGEETNVATTTYTIEVLSEGGMPIPDVKVCVYKDDKLENMVWAAETDKEGKTTFNAAESEDYIAVLEEVPSGYQVADTYPVKETQTELKLDIVLVEDMDLSEVTFELGDVMCDFSITAVDGTEYKVSELLEEKKAIVLNFWYINCGPCKMEFPYLQQAYEEYKEDIEVIAINPMDGTNDSVAAFAQDMGLTFPMAVGETEWESSMKLTAYPTTVIIDRYGTIGMIHKGMVTEKEAFAKAFAYFTADEYKQSAIRNLDDIE